MLLSLSVYLNLRKAGRDPRLDLVHFRCIRSPGDDFPERREDDDGESPYRGPTWAPGRSTVIVLVVEKTRNQSLRFPLPGETSG